jgi:hypothetical protein
MRCVRTFLDNIVLSICFIFAARRITRGDDIREIKQRVGSVEKHYTSMSNRLDRMDIRIERIERRLDLADA